MMVFRVSYEEQWSWFIKDNLVKVCKINDRIMRIKHLMGREMLNVMYTSQKAQKYLKRKF